MCDHLTKTHEAVTGHRLLVCDKFYTRLNLAKTLLVFTDGEMKMLCTVRISLQGTWNTMELEAAKARFENAERGLWKLQEKHTRAQKKLPRHQQTEYMAPMSIAPNAGYIVFRDKLTVVFYTNDLAGTPSQRVLSGGSAAAIWLFRGHAPLWRWTLDRVLHRKTFHVPAMVVAFNLFMNGVDRVEHLRSTNPI
ncbi:hypothetical protein JG688_00016426 [Phytophthora aleatoria]|uniref:PiggyBac transposable element-derived protein domain-containing protein n=1 Tax=Phytophthora aleatoria TaxID=2496075 RepID=A0A8J5M223_9STRA|nr:hypothetical protein JG688_00016426 [Phytophthora aleatoria]